VPKLPSKLSDWEVIEWALKQTELPRQRDIHGNFGDPPITVYSAPRFFIDVYFWFEGTTAMHQHGFCGAFQVMAGSSIHSWYEFEPRQTINTFCELGEMQLKSMRAARGGRRSGDMGRAAIHSFALSLDYPSVSIVVRTERSPLHLPQFSYHKPCLAIDPFYDEPTLVKKMQVLSALFRANRKDTDDQVNELLEHSDLQSSFMILSQVRSLLRSNQLSEKFMPEAAAARFDAFLATVAQTHGEAGTALKAVFEHQERHDEIVSAPKCRHRSRTQVLHGPAAKRLRTQPHLRLDQATLS
jgi:hypothetical protein